MHFPPVIALRETPAPASGVETCGPCPPTSSSSAWPSATCAKRLKLLPQLLKRRVTLTRGLTNKQKPLQPVKANKKANYTTRALWLQ